MSTIYTREFVARTVAQETGPDAIERAAQRLALHPDTVAAVVAVSARSLGITPELAEGCSGCGECRCGKAAETC